MSFSHGGTVALTLNGTIADESSVLRACLSELGIGPRQIVESMTGLSGDRSDDELQQMASYLRKELTGIEAATLADFLAKNRTRHPVAPDLTLDGQLIPVSRDELLEIFQDDKGWDRFRMKFPQSSGTVDFSRVGFNPQLTQALVYAGKQTNWLMGYGTYWLYSKSEDDWLVSGRLGAWVS